MASRKFLLPSLVAGATASAVWPIATLLYGLVAGWDKKDILVAPILTFWVGIVFAIAMLVAAPVLVMVRKHNGRLAASVLAGTAISATLSAWLWLSIPPFVVLGAAVGAMSGYVFYRQSEPEVPCAA